MLEKVRKALRITTYEFDDEIMDSIEAAKTDLGIAGVTLPDELDAILWRAIKTYCKMSFGNPSNYAELKASYDEQKAQLSMSTGYTTWESEDEDETT